jgi:hypothetical protein
VPPLCRILKDSQQLGKGVVVGNSGADALQANKVAYFNQFRPALNLSPNTWVRSPSQYVTTCWPAPVCRRVRCAVYGKPDQLTGRSADNANPVRRRRVRPRPAQQALFTQRKRR